jgi:O-methyltransferase domain/Dimerisation domain
MNIFTVRSSLLKISSFIFLSFCFYMQPVDHGEHRNKLIKLASGHIVARAVHVAAKMHIADHLVDGPCSIDCLAEKIQVDAQSLYRLLRLLASYDIFREDESHNFSLTPLAQLLISNDPNSLQAWLAYHDGDEKRWQSYGCMEYSIQTGTPSFNHIFGQGYFDYLAQDDSAAHNFDEGMRNLSEKEDDLIAACYDFSTYCMITDVGGGKGGLLASILQSNVIAHGMIYDLSHVQCSAQSYVFDRGLDQRINFTAGSFFDDTIPAGSDLYILKRILHDWDDAACVQILSHCKKAMKENTKLLIIEAIVPDDNSRDFIKDIDLAMLVLFGGKERTYEQWQKLFHAAGLQFVAVHTTASMLSIIELQI